MNAELKALIAKLEAAEEGDKDLDMEIFWQIFPYEKGKDAIWHCLPYSTSLDAALTLVPEGSAIEDFTFWPGHKARLKILATRREPFGKDRRMEWVHKYEYGRWEGEAATPALALCAAALKARAGDDE